MKLSIQTKLLALCVVLVLLGGISLSIPYYLLTTQKTRRQSQERIQIAFDIILNDFSKRIATYTARFHEFLAQNTNLQWALYSYNQYLNSYDTEWAMIRFLFQSYSELSSEIRTFGRVSLADRVMLYGSDRHLLMAYHRLDGEEFLGSSLDSQSEGHIYLPMDDLSVQSEITFRGNNADLEFKSKPLPESLIPSGIALLYADEIPDTVSIRMFRNGSLLGIRIAAPILRRDEVLGVLVGEVVYTQQIVAEYAALSKTEVNFFTGQHLSVGTLPAYTAINSADSQNFPTCEALQMQAVNIVTQPFRLNDKVYYQGGCMLTAADQAIGYVTVNLSQAIEQQELRKFITTVTTIATIGIIGCFFVVSVVFVPKFTRPILTLTDAALTLAKGELACDIDTSGTDELGTLARSFAHMRDEIQKKQAALSQLNQELEARVKRRTAEVVRQKYILETFMEHVPDAIYFKDRESRITHSNHAHAIRFGCADISELLGKTDFAFFPEELARPKYEQEQEIIRSGQPVLAHEEPDASGIWSLTSKFPLRDEHGDIIGTFGISRDITDLKQAQEELKEANREILSLNTQLKAENVRMSAELDVSRRIQQMMLPPAEELEALDGLDIVGFMKPADEVGGDYYDVLRQNENILIGIGDVTGHGLESGLIMLMTQTATRTLLEHGETDPVAMVNTLNRAIYRNVQRMGTERTLTFALLTYNRNLLTIVGQHEEVLIVRQNGQVERLNTTDLGFPIGLEEDIREWVAGTTISLSAGDGVVLYTDGITEAENVNKEQYGLERLCQSVSRHWNKSAATIQQAVIEDVLNFIGSQQIYDDLTLVVLKR